jgi:lipoate-protein ligase A
MLILANSLNSPEENLSFEEYYFNVFEEDTLRIWRNPASVIIGKHQNAFSEANLNFCHQNQIPIIRRISGGGTVFHDLGNINFSFFRFVEKGNQINYSENLKMVSDVLGSMGFRVLQSERHDLFIGETKISGNAQHVSKGRALHHGTILYDSDMQLLSNSIKRQYGHFEDKSVKSVRSKVSNLKHFIDFGTSSEFYERLVQTFIDHYTLQTATFRQNEVNPKYYASIWNFGYGPKFTLTCNEKNHYLILEIDRGGQINTVESNHEDWLVIFEEIEKFDFELISKRLNSINTTASNALQIQLFS